MYKGRIESYHKWYILHHFVLINALVWISPAGGGNVLYLQRFFSNNLPSFKEGKGNRTCKKLLILKKSC